MTREPLPYNPDIEQPSKGERKTIDGVTQGMTQQSQTVEPIEDASIEWREETSPFVTVATNPFPRRTSTAPRASGISTRR